MMKRLFPTALAVLLLLLQAVQQSQIHPINQSPRSII